MKVGEKLIGRKGLGLCEGETGMKRNKLTLYMHKAIKVLKTQRQKQNSAIISLYFVTHTHIHTETRNGVHGGLRKWLTR